MELHRSPNRLDRAWKLRQEAIASVVYDATPAFSDCRMDSLRQQRAQLCLGSFFVIVHEPRIASYVGGQYRRHPPLDPDWPILHHGPPSNPAHCTTDQRGVPNAFDGMPLHPNASI